MRIFSATPIIDYVINALGNSSLNAPIESQDERISRLYDKATRDQWSFNERYGAPPKVVNVSEWLGISDEVKVAAAKSFSSFYYGERGAKLVSAQLTVMAPTNESSKFLATQTMDEARHEEAFKR